MIHQKIIVHNNLSTLYAPRNAKNDIKTSNTDVAKRAAATLAALISPAKNILAKSDSYLQIFHVRPFPTHSHQGHQKFSWTCHTHVYLSSSDFPK